MDDAAFAGSFTLQGWENVARYLQHNSDGPIQFPPHTTAVGEISRVVAFEIFNGRRKVIGTFSLATRLANGSLIGLTMPKQRMLRARAGSPANADNVLIVADTEGADGATEGASADKPRIFDPAGAEQLPQGCSCASLVKDGSPTAEVSWLRLLIAISMAVSRGRQCFQFKSLAKTKKRMRRLRKL